MISILIPSRGLIHSHTIECLFKNLAYANYQDYEISLTHDMPIPDCFNELLSRAGADFVWWLEEDMGFPDETLYEMLNFMNLNRDKKVIGVTIDYPVAEGVRVCKYKEDRRLDYGGMGCLLIDRKALKRIGPLRSDIAYDADTGEILPYHSYKDPYTRYGQQDIYMYKNLTAKDMYVSVLKNVIGWQYRLKELGDPKINRGYHEINVLRCKEGDTSGRI